MALASAGATATAHAQSALGLRGSSPASPDASPPLVSTPGGPGEDAAPGAPARGRTARKPNPTQKLKKGKPALPPLAPYRGAPGAFARAGSGKRAATAPPPPTTAAIPAPAQQRRPRVEDDPFGPVGVDIGAGLRLRPYIEGSGGYDDNATRKAGDKKGSSFGRLEAGGDVQSDWGRHQFKANLRGGYTRYFNVDGVNRPDGEAAASLTLDATRDTQILFDARARIDSQSASSPEITSLGTVGARVSGRPLVFTEGVGAGVTQKFNRLSATLRGTIDRTDYQDARLSDGSKVALSDDGFTTYGASLRLGYEVSPGFRPFVEGSVDQRVRDNRIDASGYRRDSHALTGKAGAAIEITRTLAGEVSAGYATRRYEDSRLADLRGAVFDASLVWTATPLTTIRLRAATQMNETTLAGASGAIQRTAGVEVSHALLRNLTFTGALTLGENDYTGAPIKEKSLSASLRADYNLTRSIVVRGSFTHERLTSSSPNSDYTANVFLLGLRLQR